MVTVLMYSSCQGEYLLHVLHLYSQIYFLQEFVNFLRCCFLVAVFVCALIFDSCNSLLPDTYTEFNNCLHNEQSIKFGKLDCVNQCYSNIAHSFYFCTNTQLRDRTCCFQRTFRDTCPVEWCISGNGECDMGVK